MQASACGKVMKKRVIMCSKMEAMYSCTDTSNMSYDTISVAALLL
jgi:hypothetical protein